MRTLEEGTAQETDYEVREQQTQGTRWKLRNFNASRAGLPLEYLTTLPCFTVKPCKDVGPAHNRNKLYQPYQRHYESHYAHYGVRE
jgi:hypothetical protein